MDPIILGLVGLGTYLMCRCGSHAFHYKCKYGSWRAYFKTRPPTHIHVLSDDDGYFICWDTPLDTEAKARQVAKLWMDTYGST